MEVLPYSGHATLRQYEEMPRRLKIVRKRKQEEADLSFIPPYSEQAKYLELANVFLSTGSVEVRQENVVCIEEGRPKPTSATEDEMLNMRTLG